MWGAHARGGLCEVTLFFPHFERPTNRQNMAVEVPKKETMLHGREVMRTHTISHITRASYSSHRHSSFPWGDFPSFPELS